MARFKKNAIMSLLGTKRRHDLGGSYGTTLRLGEVLTKDEYANIAQLELGYGIPDGDRRLRELIAAANGASADDVVVTTGSIQALFSLTFLLCDRGDEVVAVGPMFPPTLGALESVGATIRTLQLSFDDGYQLDPEALAPLLSPKTKLVTLATPQNPSGVSVSRQQLERVVAIMRERSPDAYLVVDEVYREAAYANDPVPPSAISLSPRVISVASLSKAHGAPGLRIGWAIVQDPQLREQLVVAKFNTAISCSTLDEMVAIRVLEQRERILAERRISLAECLAETEAFVDANRQYVEWVRPDAGAICCIRLRSTAFDAGAIDRFNQSLEQQSVLISNGTWFGESPNVFRVGFGHLPIDELREAFKALRVALLESAKAAV